MVVTVVLRCGRTATNQRLLQQLLMLLSDNEVVAETAPEKLATLLAP